MKWRYCCPEGHVSLKTRSRQPGYYCRACAEVYESAPIDKKREDVPA